MTAFVSRSIVGPFCLAGLEPGQHRIRWRIGAVLGGQLEVDETCGHEPEEDQAAFLAERPAAVGKRPACVGNCGGQFGQAEAETGAQGGDHQ